MIKRAIKRIIGPNKIKKISSFIKYYSSLKYNNENIKILSDDVEKTYKLENPKGHIFCGYFDLNPDNPNNKNEILVGMLNKKARKGIDDLTIAIANYEENTIKPVTTTKAWCWQMGSRLRWSNKENIIYYNDFVDNRYCCNAYDISKNKVVSSIPYALYDISSDEKYGLSVNFSRLQKLRPGYGYCNLVDNTINDNAPENDGLFMVDMKTGKSELLVSLNKLSNLLPESCGNQCYINHISISPNCKNALFFFIWKTDKNPGWKATLWVINVETKKLKCLEKVDQVSHYDWKDNNKIVITGYLKNTKNGFYRIYDSNDGTFETLENKNLNVDGHPVFSRLFNGFYSDTYPNKEFKQRFFKYDEGNYVPLVELYHNPKMYDEKRCDLHPHYFRNGELIALDTTFEKNRREVLIVRMKNE